VKLPDAITSFTDIIKDTTTPTDDALAAARALQEQVGDELKSLDPANFRHSAASQIAWLVTRVAFLTRLVTVLGEQIHGVEPRELAED